MRRGQWTVTVFIVSAGLLWAGTAGAQPFPGGLRQCRADLAACEAKPHTVFPGDGQEGHSTLDFGLEHGPALSYTDNMDGTFTDNNTLLMWEKKLVETDSACTDLEQANRNVHCVNNSYTWTETGDGDFTDPDGPLFTDFLDKLNNTCDGAGVAPCDGICTCGLAGHRDWRIPTVKELLSIVDYGTFNPASSFPGSTRPSGYWSSTSNAASLNAAWLVDFVSGLVYDNGFKGIDSLHARAVRAGQ